MKVEQDEVMVRGPVPGYITAIRRALQQRPSWEEFDHHNVYHQAEYRRLEELRFLLSTHQRLCKQYGRELGRAYFEYVYGTELFNGLYGSTHDDDNRAATGLCAVLLEAPENFAAVLAQMMDDPKRRTSALTAQLRAIQEMHVKDTSRIRPY